MEVYRRLCIRLIGTLLVSRSGLVEENSVKCFIPTVFTCPILFYVKFCPFRENNIVVVFPFPFHIPIPLGILWFIRLQG